jgi:Domain of unknown function (DUF2341)/Kelch motif
MQKTFFLMLFTIGIVTCALTSLNAQTWMSDNWAHRRLVTISNPGATVLSGYQVKITLINSTFNFNDAKNDGSDIRLTASDGATLIPFWIEEWNFGTQATIWVKVPSIPTSGTTVYLYYGNNAAPNAANGFNTFQFFDDFELWKTTPASIWQDKAPMPTPIADIATVVYSGKIYSIGGYGNGPMDPQNKNYLYDPVANTWTEKLHMPSARWGMAAVEYNGLIFVFGGSVDTSIGNVRKNEVYNTSLNTWTTKASMPTTISHQGLAAIKFGTKIHLFYETYHYEYDPSTDIYTAKANVPNPRFWSTVAVVGTKIYLIGGYHAGVATNYNQALDPATNTWTTKAPSPAVKWGTARENPVINGLIYVTHGLDGNLFHSSNFVYDPVANIWTQKGPAVHARDGVGGGVINNKLYIIGGRSNLDAPVGLGYNEVYDPSIDTFTPQPGPDWWATSGTSYVYANDSAKFQGNYGLVVQQSTDATIQRFAQTGLGFGSVYALDFDWEITDIGGIGTQPKPQGLIALTETDPNGSLFFYNSGGMPELTWYNGSYNHLQNSTWNSWHKVTVVRNGNNSRVTFDGNLYQSPLIMSPPTTGTGRIQFGLYFATRQYLDNVRIRQWTGADAVSSVGAPQSAPSHTLTLTALIEGLYNGTLMVSDTVTVELHNATSPYSLIESHKGILNTAGVGTFTFTTVVNGTNYYILVKHRNGLETWSAGGNSFSSYALSYDFTTSQNKAYGSNLVQKGTKWCIYSGDINHDGLVDLSDLITIDNDNANNVTGYVNTDVNGDGIVNQSDMLIVYNNNKNYVIKNVPPGAPGFMMVKN